MMYQRLVNNGGLQFALHGFGYVLEVAATARTCRRTQHLPAFWVSTHNLNYVSTKEAGFYLCDDDPHTFTRKRMSNKGHQVACARHHVTPMRHLAHFHFENVSNRYGLGAHDGAGWRQF
jgi:hypothetical protein